MSDFYAFAGTHPVLTFLLGCLAVSAIGAFRPFECNCECECETEDEPESEEP